MAGVGPGAGGSQDPPCEFACADGNTGTGECVCNVNYFTEDEGECATFRSACAHPTDKPSPEIACGIR